MTSERSLTGWRNAYYSTLDEHMVLKQSKKSRHQRTPRGRPDRSYLWSLSTTMTWPIESGDREFLDRQVASGIITKLDRGLYLHTPGNITEGHELAAIAVRLPSAIIGLTSALAYHDLTTSLATAVFLGLAAGRHAPRWTWPAIAPFRVPRRSFPFGIQAVMIEGVNVPITDPARTVVECFYHRDRIGSAICLEGLRTAILEKRCAMDDIWKHATAFRIADIVCPYAEAFAAIR
jgi:hypothetical protein